MGPNQDTPYFRHDTTIYIHTHIYTKIIVIIDVRIKTQKERFQKWNMKEKNTTYLVLKISLQLIVSYYQPKDRNKD